MISAGFCPAASATQGSRGGYSDWFLPSQSETSALGKLKKAGIGNIAAAMYWSSSQLSSANGNTIDFTSDPSGFTSSAAKGTTLKIRAVRMF